MYAEIYEILKESIKEINAAKAKLAVLNEKIDSGIYAVPLQKKFIEERDALKRELDNMGDTAIRKASAVYDVTIAQIRDRDVLDPSDFLSGDIRILQSGLKLKKKDILHMLKKPENDNAGMKRLIKQYADEHNIEFTNTEREDFLCSTTEVEAQELETEKASLRYVRNWICTERADYIVDSVYKAPAIAESEN